MFKCFFFIKDAGNGSCIQTKFEQDPKLTLKTVAE